ncbi:hypothetical protein [Streptomyces sp. NRRL B-24572]|uniref:hypothetical protein n=1 Tax=Streptomyces sp. NRRL B-24572 TaxID=1962156 RepID=UPI0015C5144A|nr:hypothetical protein [Streptomyces sp. NRRL B-24572]
MARPGREHPSRPGIHRPHEYLLHDGSTEDQQASTIAFWLGRWLSGNLLPLS